ncbi:hypothetical protein DENSPDRAFT_835628 [Dentipellis sp. KUC8613]|nr:hypothetical protein DENSPDRAFT_835628 [Dentipellis sp. KUC8613]
MITSSSRYVFRRVRLSVADRVFDSLRVCPKPRRWVARQKAAFFPSTSIEQPSTEATVAETPSSTAEAA